MDSLYVREKVRGAPRPKMSPGSPAPTGHHMTFLHQKSLPSSSHVVSLLHLFLPLRGLHFVNHHTAHVDRVPCVWLAGPAAPSSLPKVLHNRKPLPTTYRGATILFSHHFMAESCHFVRCCNPRFSHCSVIGWWLFVTLSYPTCSQVALWLAVRTSLLFLCMLEEHHGSNSPFTKYTGSAILFQLFYGGDLPLLTRAWPFYWLPIGTTKC